MELKEIIELKKSRLLSDMEFVNPTEMKEIALGIKRDTISFSNAISGEGLSFIPEIKRISDSGRVSLKMYEPETAATELANFSEISALLVQTERDVYKGSAGHLRAVRKVVSLPLVRRDYIIAPYQVYESRVIGADAVLLIAGLFDEQTLSKFVSLAESLSMEAVVEVHDRHEIESTVRAGAKIINIYNKTVHSIETEIDKIKEYLDIIPSEIKIILEGGISNPTEISVARELGVSGIVLGDYFMQTDDFGKTLRWLDSETAEK